MKAKFRRLPWRFRSLSWKEVGVVMAQKFYVCMFFVRGMKFFCPGFNTKLRNGAVVETAGS